ncbi:MAG: hypothetical protein P1V81_15605 [Planctomycetota bacterium]|nr:hypothetical protein [Planctomycetota bacterium]
MRASDQGSWGGVGFGGLGGFGAGHLEALSHGSVAGVPRDFRRGGKAWLRAGRLVPRVAVTTEQEPAGAHEGQPREPSGGRALYLQIVLPVVKS